MFADAEDFSGSEFDRR